MPTFLKDVLKFDIKSVRIIFNQTIFKLNSNLKYLYNLKKNGLISAIPYIASAILNMLSSIVSDKLVQSGKLTRTKSRKIFGAIGMFVPLASVIGLAFVTCANPGIGIALLVIGIAFT